MEVSRIRALRGPNLWSRHTAIEAIVACEPGELSKRDIAGFEPRLRALFPSIGELRPRGHVGSISLAHVLEIAALALQAQAGCPVTFSRTSATVGADVPSPMADLPVGATFGSLVHAVLEHTDPGIVSRGYGRRSQEPVRVGAGTPPELCGDEPLLIARRTGQKIVPSCSFFAVGGEGSA